MVFIKLRYTRTRDRGEKDSDTARRPVSNEGFECVYLCVFVSLSVYYCRDEIAIGFLPISAAVVDENASKQEGRDDLLLQQAAAASN